jgi:hypothetical protein
LAPNLKEARTDLLRLKLRERMMFIGDRVVGGDLPEWVTRSDQTTDGHLLALAKTSGTRLVTLDRGIRGAELIAIPHEANSPPPALAMHCRCGA